MRKYATPMLVLLLVSPASAALAQEDEAPGAEVAPVVPAPAIDREQLPPTRVEWFVGIFGGGVEVADTTVSATYQCILCPSVRAEKQVHFDRGEEVGLRTGLWGGDRLDVLGVAFELAQTKAKASQVDVRYVAFSLVPLVRLPFFRTEAMPGGHLDLHAGLVITRVIDGEVRVAFPELPRTVSGNPKGLGVGYLVGASARWWRVALLAEYRVTSMDLTFSDVGDQGEASLQASQALLGLAWIF